MSKTLRMLASECLNIVPYVVVRVMLLIMDSKFHLSDCSLSYFINPILVEREGGQGSTRQQKLALSSHGREITISPLVSGKKGGGIRWCHIHS